MRRIECSKPYGIARIEIISAKNLRQANSWFVYGASDPYIKISNVATSWVYGDSRVIYNNCDPVWEQVFYIVHDVNEKFNLQVLNYNAFFKHKLLGFYILDLKNIIKEFPNGSYEGKKLKHDANLTYKGSNRGQLSFVADFFSLPESGEGEILTLNNVSIRHLYLLITYQSQYDCFELTDSLAKLFNFSSKEELINAFSDFVQNDETVRNLDHKIWATALVTSFLKVLLWKDYNRAESWLSANVPNVEVEERLYNYSNKFVIQHFEVTQWVDENQQRSLSLLVTSKRTIITRRYVDTRIVRRFLNYQNESGCFELIPQLAEALVDFRNHWVDEYQKVCIWICQQVPGNKLREELLEAAIIFVVKRFEVQDDAINEDETFKESIEVKDRFQSQGQDQNLEMVEEPDPEEEAPIPNDEVVGIIRILVKDAKNLKKSDPYIRETISFEIYDEQLFIADQPCGTYILNTNILLKNEDQSKPIVGLFPLQIDKKPVRGHLNLEVQFFATGFNEGENFVFSKDTIKQQHLYMLISWRNANRSFEFTNKLGRFFNYKSVDEMKENFFALLSSDKDLLKYDLFVFATALTIIKEINNVVAEDRLYNLCKTFIIERFKVKNLEKEQLEIIEPAKVTIINRKIITIRHVRTLLSHQSDDGCVVLNEKVAEYFGFSVDEFLQHLRKYFKTERVTKLHHGVWVTACVIWYLRLVAVDHRHEWIVNYEKSSEWLTNQCNGDTFLEEEINECARKFVVSRYEVEKDAIDADNSFVAAIKTKDVAIEEEKNELKRQKKDTRYVTQKYNFTPEDLLKLIAEK
ncbi:membrane bound c2 domain-containing protein [Gigaspora margarita]|uniref:Membrane bound c2 domain-containing protein n=1 Tax=Gigaspora margarita TaxID=4874 RepID=A0A8H4AYY9_GIGMA|nr:membrane bound c2 domain-containing protein [Gigaspora margarita]